MAPANAFFYEAIDIRCGQRTRSRSMHMPLRNGGVRDVIARLLLEETKVRTSKYLNNLGESGATRRLTARSR